MEFRQFEFDLSGDIQRAITDMGYEEPTPIQAGAIPPMLEKKDIIGQAQTGTGKTAAFGIPLVSAINTSEHSVQALVLCPTRELALQTAGELQKIARYRRGVSVLAVYGGQPIERQLRALSHGVQIVVGTPGRVMDHMRRGSLDLSGVKVAVLDEADEMLDMGFRDDIEEILKATPEERQTALFSATMPRPILQLANRYLSEPVHIKIANKELTVERIAQSFINVRAFHKLELLVRLLIRDNVKLALVFCNTKRCVEDVVTQLQSRGFSAAGLHGDMRQIERDAIMGRFRQGTVGVLVATDVAARGLDVDDIEVVFNYDIPQDVEYYVHRIGRTGRAGKDGRAYTFTVGREIARMWEYRRITGAKFVCEQAPTGEELKAIKAQRMIEQIAQKVEAGEHCADTQALAASLLNKVGAEQALETMLSMLLKMSSYKTMDDVDLKVPEDRRPPTPERRGPYGQPAHKDRRPPYYDKKPYAPRRDTRRNERKYS